MADITITPAGAAFNPADTVTSTRLNEARNPTAALVAASILTADIADANVTAAKLATDALELAYPVGSIYMNATVATNPGTLLGFGTWIEFSTGRILLGVGEGTDDQATPESKTFAAGDTGGQYKHTLDITEIPAHNHSQNNFTTGYNVDYGSGWGPRPIDKVSGSPTDYPTDSSGGGTPHDNIQPYITVYMWTRTI